MASRSTTVSQLQRRHGDLCFRRAFPCSATERAAVADELGEFAATIASQPASVRDGMADSGIAGTPLYYRFSFDVAKWLAREVPGKVSIDWSDLHDTESLDNLLRCIMQPAEDEFFDSGDVDTREWIDIARAGCDGTDFDWLMAQLQNKRLQKFYRQLYDAADLPLAWQLSDSPRSKTGNVFSTTRRHLRNDDMRGRPRQVKRMIAEPLDSIRRLSGARGAELLNVAIASLAARHRETYHFNFANPDEIYMADVGRGIGIAIFGLLPEHRFPVECTMGYLILSNGVPIGYGGSSLLFKQVNTGINIFDEYRGSEAAFLWVQVMRVYHALTACTRFVANPYQLGSENREALRSGAFWFYYRLGYRPVDREVRELAKSEQAIIEHRSGYRSDLATLRRLTSCDMHLTLPGARQAEFFDEKWLSTSSGLVTQVLGRAGGKNRQVAARRVARQVAHSLATSSPRASRTWTGTDAPLRSDNEHGQALRSWTGTEIRGLIALAPFFAAVGPETWSASEKRDALKLLRAKGGRLELDYARRLATSDTFLQSLRSACIAASRNPKLKESRRR